MSCLKPKEASWRQQCFQQNNWISKKWTAGDKILAVFISKYARKAASGRFSVWRLWRWFWECEIIPKGRKKVRKYLDINGFRRNVERCRIMRKMTVKWLVYNTVLTAFFIYFSLWCFKERYIPVRLSRGFFRLLSSKNRALTLLWRYRGCLVLRALLNLLAKTMK